MLYYRDIQVVSVWNTEYLTLLKAPGKRRQGPAWWHLRSGCWYILLPMSILC